MCSFTNNPASWIYPSMKKFYPKIQSKKPWAVQNTVKTSTVQIPWNHFTLCYIKKAELFKACLILHSSKCRGWAVPLLCLLGGMRWHGDTSFATKHTQTLLQHPWGSHSHRSLLLLSKTSCWMSHYLKIASEQVSLIGWEPACFPLFVEGCYFRCEHCCCFCMASASCF